jgi:hypothetical protein
MNGGSKQGKFRGKRKHQATLEKKGMCRESDAMPLDGQDAWNHYWHRPEIIRPLPPQVAMCSPLRQHTWQWSPVERPSNGRGREKAQQPVTGHDTGT